MSLTIPTSAELAAMRRGLSAEALADFLSGLVVEAAREALAILEGNHPAGDFRQPAEVAADVLREALIAHDSQEGR